MQECFGFMFSIFVAKKTTLVAKFLPSFALRPTFFGKNATKFFIEISPVFFFVDCKVWNLSFQTHSDSSKNIKNSLFCAILKIFCHSWLRAKKGYFRQNMDFWAKKPPKNRFYETTSKCREKFAFYYFLLRISLEILWIGCF